MLKRKLGKTGEKLTVVGFGGIVVKGLEQPIANGIVAKAAEEYGLNYFDVAPSYGNSEQVLGPAPARPHSGTMRLPNRSSNGRWSGCGRITSICISFMPSPMSRKMLSGRLPKMG